ncbi:hypothetical protein M422DRAFT_64012 [Sphaerobolus stellatus SS14]|nr:hypothetical protein M422DRAFT_64012 [Sphaerobolus stellatus SS14]
MSFESSPTGIFIPAQFCRDGPASIPELRSYVAACIEFLSSPMVSSILKCHPNDVAIQGPDPKWESWWRWAANGKSKWTSLIPGWNQNSSSYDVPNSLKDLLDKIDSLCLPRNPDANLDSQQPSLRGMSPKKSHEVSCISNFMQHVLHDSATEVKHAVDVGAGQGYLSRNLCSPPLSINVLALDFSEIQTKGAERRTTNSERKKNKTTFSPNTTTGSEPGSSAGSLTHEMAHINPVTLKSTTSDWISSTCRGAELPVPVLFVALHACGTLTPDIFRCFLENCNKGHPVRGGSDGPSWYASGLVVAGCCYNLMSPDLDFPLSNLVKEEQNALNSSLYLAYNHRSLAAQSPLQWSLTPASRKTAELAIRKVVYRALFGKLALAGKSPGHADDLQDDRILKIGRLPDTVYTSIETFISEAERKTGTKIQRPIPVLDDGGDDTEYSELLSCLEVLHALRSRIGPVVESLIIVDRYLYLVENLQGRKVAAINLFDQAQGSGRNVVLVVYP